MKERKQVKGQQTEEKRREADEVMTGRGGQEKEAGEGATGREREKGSS